MSAQCIVESGAAGLSGLYDLTAQRLVRFAVTITRNQHDAEDAVQASLVRVVAAPQVLTRADAPWPYLLRIVRNESLVILRKKRRWAVVQSLTDLLTSRSVARLSFPSIALRLCYLGDDVHVDYSHVQQNVQRVRAKVTCTHQNRIRDFGFNQRTSHVSGWRRLCCTGVCMVVNRRISSKYSISSIERSLRKFFRWQHIQRRSNVTLCVDTF